MQVGGEKGHIVENIDGKVRTLYCKYSWKPIPRCTGRYTCRDHSVHTLPPDKLLSHADKETVLEFELKGRNDRILVLPLDETNETGIITYVKDGGTEDDVRYVHTLNAVSGFRRKLEAIGICVDSESIWVSDG